VRIPGSYPVCTHSTLLRLQCTGLGAKARTLPRVLTKRERGKAKVTDLRCTVPKQDQCRQGDLDIVSTGQEAPGQAFTGSAVSIIARTEREGC
jgi:hypothetical protein